MYVLYYASMLWCWHLVWILVRTNDPCLGVGHHSYVPSQSVLRTDASRDPSRAIFSCIDEPRAYRGPDLLPGWMDKAARW
jgi:hypothetical protein